MTGHTFIRPGQVAPDRPPPDRCMQCGEPEAAHRAAGSLLNVALSLDAMTGALGPALAAWATRDGTQPQPGVRQAANVAMAAIDDGLATLHRVRGQLVTEVRRFDDATMARVDAMLAEREAGGGR